MLRRYDASSATMARCRACSARYQSRRPGAVTVSLRLSTSPSAPIAPGRPRSTARPARPAPPCAGRPRGPRWPLAKGCPDPRNARAGSLRPAPSGRARAPTRRDRPRWPRPAQESRPRPSAPQHDSAPRRREPGSSDRSGPGRTHPGGRPPEPPARPACPPRPRGSGRWSRILGRSRPDPVPRPAAGRRSRPRPAAREPRPDPRSRAGVLRPAMPLPRPIPAPTEVESPSLPCRCVSRSGRVPRPPSNVHIRCQGCNDWFQERREAQIHRRSRVRPRELGIPERHRTVQSAEQPPAVGASRSRQGRHPRFAGVSVLRHRCAHMRWVC